MSERLRESLSALMDDEADDLELGRILRAMDSGEADLGATWSRYQLVSAVLKGSPNAVGLEPLAIDLTAADAEDGVVYGGAVDGDAENNHGVVPERGRARRALSSFAVAASITAVAVVGWQWQAGGDVESAQMAGGASTMAPATAPTVAILPGLRAADQRGLLQASQPGRVSRDPARIERSPAMLTTEAMEAGMRQQVEAYMVRHAEHNALHSRSGMMSFARMAAFDGAQ